MEDALKRHESEIVRDAILATSGALDVRMEGQPVPLKPNADGSVEVDSSKLSRPSDAGRRSVYLFARRNYQLTELGVFDQPVVATNCTCRTSSAVVSQSLALLNGRFAFEQAQLFARAASSGQPAQPFRGKSRPRFAWLWDARHPRKKAGLPSHS